MSVERDINDFIRALRKADERAVKFAQAIQRDQQFRLLVEQENGNPWQVMTESLDAFGETLDTMIKAGGVELQ